HQNPKKGRDAARGRPGADVFPFPKELLGAAHGQRRVYRITIRHRSRQRRMLPSQLKALRLRTAQPSAPTTQAVACPAYKPSLWTTGLDSGGSRFAIRNGQDANVQDRGEGNEESQL